MSHLYYENLPGMKSEKKAHAVMLGVFFNLEPYFNFIRSVERSVSKNVKSIIIEPISLEEILIEELSLYITDKSKISVENLDYYMNQTELTKQFDRQFKRVMKCVQDGVGKVFRLVEDSDDEKIDYIKEQFLGAEEIYLSKSPKDSRRIRIIFTYPPYDLLVLEDRWASTLKEPRRVYLRSNLYQLEVILQSLRILRDRPLDYNRNLIRLFPNFFEVEDWEEVNIQENEWLFLKNQNREGTAEQREFVEIALETPDFAILEGPPGSGKTTTICEIIYQAIKRGLRILLVASTHVAVDNVLEQLMDRNTDFHDDVKRTILPIRIGRTDRISDLATEYHEETFWASERKRLRTRLERIRNKTESQKSMLDLLKSPETSIKNQMSNAFIRAANLVCGTTIGILKHPEIRRIRRGGKTLVPYDLLILDEASKTTFQEFMVPALVAERFIIVGDINQLPPYVEEEGVISNVTNQKPFETSWTTTFNNITKCANRYPNSKWIIELEKPLSEEEKNIIEKLAPPSFPTVILSREGSSANYTLLGYSIIIGTADALTKFEKLLPLGVNWTKKEKSNLLTPITKVTRFDFLDRWSRGLKAINKLKPQFRENFANDTSWEEAISWRLVRDFELRLTKNDHYKQEIQALIPSIWTNGEKREFNKILHSLKRLAFPSIIELLQKGFERSEYQTEHDLGSCLTDGLPKDELKQRHIKLRYQHRMNPEISRFPREKFYDEDALIDVPHVETYRDLKNENYQKAVLWIHRRCSNIYRNSNEEEAEAILSELRSIRQWARNHPKTGQKPWEIAILPFYKGQERLIRRKLQRMFHSSRKRTFRDLKNNLVVELCVVDRFQGHEADIVFLSFVQNWTVGFLDTPNRLNVALTRAKYQLFLVGNRYFFRERQNRSELLKKLAENTPEIRSYRGS